MQQDDPILHDEDEQTSIDDDSSDTTVDDEVETPEDTDQSDDPKKETAEDVKNRQKTAWINKIKEGTRTLDDMPANLNWLKKEIAEELSEKRPEKRTDELESRIQKTLQAEREKEDFNLLTDYLQESTIDEEDMASVRETYEDLRKDGVGKLKALKVALRTAGLKDAQTMITERRKKGMLLPPQGTRSRKTVSKDNLTDMERKFNKDLPNGFKV